MRTETLQAVSTASLQTVERVAQNTEQLARLASLAQEMKNEQDTREAAWQVRLGQIEEVAKKNGQRIDVLMDEFRRMR